MSEKTTPTKFKPTKLFHAVVILGAALASGSATPTAVAASDADAMSSSTESFAMSPGTCPPGSERPFPPCYWIK